MQNSCHIQETLKDNATVKLYHDEYQQRNIKTSSLTKQSLQASLELEMYGIQQMSAIYSLHHLLNLITYIMINTR